jgi:uncharacterized protein YneF (UPF0154 family)
MEHFIAAILVLIALIGFLIGGLYIVGEFTARYRKYEDFNAEDLRKMEQRYAAWKAGRKRID